jgi:hypothetical protein
MAERCFKIRSFAASDAFGPGTPSEPVLLGTVFASRKPVVLLVGKPVVLTRGNLLVGNPEKFFVLDVLSV